MTLNVGQPAPDLTVEAYVLGEPQPCPISLSALRGQWVVLFFYPRDFTFVCPTELQAFARLHPQFLAEQAVVLGASTDSYHCHKAWFETDPRLQDVAYPIIADTTHALADALGVLGDDGAALRGTFIIDPEGVVRHVQVNDLDVGRNVEETLRLLRAFRTGERCPAAWTPGQETLGKAPPPMRAAEEAEAITRVTDETMAEVLEAEWAILVLTKRDCGYCAAYQAGIEGLLARGELEDMVIGKLVLDERGATRFKRDNPWLADGEVLPYTVLYRRGARIDGFAGSSAAYLREWLATGLAPAA
ncbi:MAG: peroxiredoxin [Chloroflexota bacterium]|nr:peroxiredoxin [Chloroflexota bacterium]